MFKLFFEDFNPQDHLFWWLFIAFFFAFIIAYTTFPTVIYISKQKQLMDEPGGRSMHKNTTPTLGGISIYFSLIVVMTIVGAFLNTKTLVLVMGGLTILFFMGLKDDLTIISPIKKLFGQLLAAGLLIVFTDTRILGFSSIMGVNELPYWISIGFTLFVYVLIINAYNLIDGVDGLAGSIALGVCLVFTYLFVDAGKLSLATLAIALVGSLLAYLRFNFSGKNKIFMGDTGTMVVGFLLAFFTISFINLAQTDSSSVYFRYAPVLAFALLFYPLIDTLRVFLLRIVIYKKSPFAADRKHIHHKYLFFGFTHAQTTLLIASFNVIIVFLTFFIAIEYDLTLNRHILLLMVYGSYLYLIPVFFKWLFKTF